MDKQDKIRILRQCPLFSALSPQELDLIQKIIHIKDYDKQRIIFPQDESCLGFYMLVDGSVKIYRISPDGKEQILHLVQPRNTFAEASLFLGGKYPANSATVKKSRLFFFPKTEFLNLLKSDTDLSLKLMAGLSQWLHRLVNLVDTLSLKDAESRLATYLLSLIPANQTKIKDSYQIQIPIAKNILASHLGISSETLSRTLRKFQSGKLISMDKKSILIRDIKKLTGISDLPY